MGETGEIVVKARRRRQSTDLVTLRNWRKDMRTHFILIALLPGYETRNMKKVSNTDKYTEKDGMFRGRTVCTDKARILFFAIVGYSEQCSKSVLGDDAGDAFKWSMRVTDLRNSLENEFLDSSTRVFNSTEWSVLTAGSPG